MSSNYQKIEIERGGGYQYAIRKADASAKLLVRIGIHSSALKDLLTDRQWEQWVTDETNIFSIGKKKLEKFCEKYSNEY